MLSLGILSLGFSNNDSLIQKMDEDLKKIAQETFYEVYPNDYTVNDSFSVKDDYGEIKGIPYTIKIYDGSMVIVIDYPKHLKEKSLKVIKKKLGRTVHDVHFDKNFSPKLIYKNSNKNRK